MPKLRILTACAALLFSTLACVTIMGKNSPETVPPINEAPVTTEVPAADEGAEAISCPLITDLIIEMNSPELVEGESETMDFGGRDDVIEAYLVTYVVSGNEITDPYYEDVQMDLQDEQNDIAKHQEIWDYFSALIPFEYRQHLAEFSVMTDGQDSVLAAVAQTYDDPALWSLEVDIADSDDYYYFSYTLVHEYAHLLTLGPDQVPPSEAIFNNPEDDNIYLSEVSACPNYFPGEGCANSDSYINAFYYKFWVNIIDEWNDINLEEDDDIYYERLDQLYYDHQDEFVTDYAVTHLAEDIAESFSFFVFSSQPAGDTVAEQKILFFYQYPELVELRTNILSNLCTSFPQ